MKTFIIHVKTATEREKQIRAQLDGKIADYTFILDADKNDLTSELLHKYFRGQMVQPQNLAATSCAMKQLISYQKLLESHEDFALILEDDIILKSKFTYYLPLFISEIKSRKLHNFLLSIEDSSLTYVPGSQRKKNRYLYAAQKGRMAGAYLLDREAAKTLLNIVKNEGCDVPIDWFHNECADRNLVTIYWSHPAIAVQGSLNGKASSLIDSKKKGVVRELIFSVQRIYKQLLFRFR